MKKILIATDFSRASLNAGKYAVELSRYFSAKLHIVNTYQRPVEIPEISFLLDVEQVEEEAMKQLDAEIKVINRYNGAQMTKNTLDGAPADTIVSEAKKINADLIVCGMKDSGKAIKRIFGSTVTDLASKTSIPLLIVPEDAYFKLPSNIVFAGDAKTIPSEKQVKFLKEFGKNCNARLSIVSVLDGSQHKSIQLREHYAELIDELRSMRPCIDRLHGSDIAVELEKYINDNFINMIVMVPHEHNFLERIFTNSITKQMAFLSAIPLLILPENLTVDKIDHRDMQKENLN